MLHSSINTFFYNYMQCCYYTDAITLNPANRPCIILRPTRAVSGNIATSRCLTNFRQLLLIRNRINKLVNLDHQSFFLNFNSRSLSPFLCDWQQINPAGEPPRRSRGLIKTRFRMRPAIGKRTHGISRTIGSWKLPNQAGLNKSIRDKHEIK